MAGGGAAPGLLAQVGVVAHVAVELVQLVAGRQQRLLHGAALHARQQVAVAAGLVARGGEGLRQRGVPVGAGDAQAEIAVAYAAGGLRRRHGAGFPHERATLHVALRRERRQAGRQGAPGQLGGLLEARVLGVPGQVQLDEASGGGARRLGQRRTPTRASPWTCRFPVCAVSAASSAISAAARAIASGLSVASDIAASRRCARPGASTGSAQRLEHRAVDLELASARASACARAGRRARASLAMRSWRSAYSAPTG